MFAGLVRRQRTNMRNKGGVSRFDVTVFFMVRRSHIVRHLHYIMRHTSIATVTKFVTRQPSSSQQVIFLHIGVTGGTLSMSFFPLQVINGATSVTSVDGTIQFSINFHRRGRTMSVARFMGAQVIQMIDNARKISVILLRRLRVFLSTVRSGNTTFTVVIIIAISTIRRRVAIVSPRRAITRFSVARTGTL